MVKKFEAPIIRIVTTADGPVCFDITKEVEQVLKKDDDKYYLLEGQVKTVVFLPNLLGSVKKDDYVAMHWGLASLILNKNQLSNIKKYTSTIINILNGA